MRRPRRLLKTVIAFAMAHSLTLAPAMFGVLHLPLPLDAAIVFLLLSLGPELLASPRVV